MTDDSIQERPILDYGQQSSYWRAGVEQIDSALRRDTLFRFLGLPGSGLFEVQDQLLRWGYDVGMNAVRRHGTCSYYFYADSPWFPVHGEDGGHVGHRLSDYHFRHTVHVCDHPLHVIRALAERDSPWLWDFSVQTGMLPESASKWSPLRRAMAVWCNVSETMESLAAYHVRRSHMAEDLEAMWPEIQQGALKATAIKEASTAWKLTWQQLADESYEVFLRVNRIASELDLLSLEELYA